MGRTHYFYRKIAEDCLKRIVRSKPLVEHALGFRVYGSGEITESAQDVAKQNGLNVDVAKYLMEFYGHALHWMVLADLWQ